jgi:signal peptidase I
MAETKKKTEPAADKPKGPSDPILANRETVESVIVAVILALLFRAFVAEAFVIPTGSMAPTLMGRHVDVWCDQCKYHYEGGGSAERTRDDQLKGIVVANARCPNCGYRKDLETTGFFSNERSFSGDRIIVSKFAFEMGDPQRWDVIVFKFPGEAQQNYIKRLIGLPGETIKIQGGNIYVKAPDAADFRIARKPDPKLLTLLQIVHDADYPAATLIKSGWPARWRPYGSDNAWQSDELGQVHTLASTDSEALLRYHHVDPAESDWLNAEEGKEHSKSPGWPGRLISDFYAYNSTQIASVEAPDSPARFHDSDAYGKYWVDDLAVECEVEIGEPTGEVVLDLVRGGSHYTCRIDAKTGLATLSARDADGQVIKLGEGDKRAESIQAATAVKGNGKHHLRLSNVDHELRLWVDRWRVPFPGATSYESEPLLYPDVASPNGDLAPVGVGGRGQALTVRHLRVLRDKYYIACRINENEIQEEYKVEPSAYEIARLLSDPGDPNLQDEFQRMLRSRRSQEFVLGADKFMPMGDNSPQSSDARYWPTADRKVDAWQDSFVERRLLVGKAIFIYWPHSWNMPPFFPNFRKMQPIW